MKRTLSGCTLVLAWAFVCGAAHGVQETNPYEMFQQEQPGSALTLDQLETVLEMLGYKPVTHVPETGNMFLAVVCNDGYADLEVCFSISGEGMKILMSTALAVDLNVDSIRAEQWTALLRTANSHRTDNFYLQEEPFLLGLRRSFDNRAVNPEVVKTEIEGMMASIVHFRPAWVPIWEMAGKKDDSAAPVTSLEAPAMPPGSFVTERSNHLFSKPANNNDSSGQAINQAIELWNNKYHLATEIIGGVWKQTDSEGALIAWEFFENGRARWSRTAADGSSAGTNFGFELSGSTITTSYDGHKNSFDLEWVDGETVHLVDTTGQRVVFRR